MAEVDDSYSWIVWGVPLIVVAVLLCFVLIIYLLRRHVRGSMYKGEAVDMVGKTVLITGANTGIGKETARDLAKRGAKVTILCRNMDKGSAAAEEIRQDTGKSVGIQKLDLSSFESIRECAAILKEQESKIHILINNAGIALCPEWKTKDGLEMQIGTNHFGHFLLTLLLLDNIKAAAPGRIISVSSLVHKMGTMHWDDINMTKKYSPNEAYNQSKLANVLFTTALSRKLKGTGVTTYAVHPGVVKSDWARYTDSSYGSFAHGFFMALQTFVSQDTILGAQTSVACAVDKQFGKDSGKYYSNCKETPASSQGRNKDDAERLWKISLETVGLNNFVI